MRQRLPGLHCRNRCHDRAAAAGGMIAPEMTEIWLIRHGETAWNAGRRLQGHMDIALNTEGERQAAALGLALRHATLNAVISSDLSRARQTAQAIAGHHGLPVEVEAGLRERCFGAFEGMTYSEISVQYPVAHAAWQARTADAVLPPGERAAETFRHFYARSLNAIMGCVRRNQGRKIAIVAHGGVLECAYRAALAMPLDTPRNFPVHNASINRFTAKTDGGQVLLTLTGWGDVGHLCAPVMDDLQ